MKKTESIFDSQEGCMAVAMYNLCVRNNINPRDFINTIRETRIKIKKEIDKRKKEIKCKQK